LTAFIFQGLAKMPADITETFAFFYRSLTVIILISF
jgi:hypothetical protein